MKLTINLTLIIIAALAFIIAWRAISTWKYISAQRTLFEFGAQRPGAGCEMRGTEINCN